jgi:hypothetical protein
MKKYGYRKLYSFSPCSINVGTRPAGYAKLVSLSHLRTEIAISNPAYQSTVHSTLLSPSPTTPKPNCMAFSPRALPSYQAMGHDKGCRVVSRWPILSGRMATYRQQCKNRDPANTPQPHKPSHRYYLYPPRNINTPRTRHLSTTLAANSLCCNLVSFFVFLLRLVLAPFHAYRHLYTKLATTHTTL